MEDHQPIHDEADVEVGQTSTPLSNSRQNRQPTITASNPIHVAQPRERILSTPRKFQPGEDPLVWIEDFNLTAKGNNWHAATKLNTVGLYLAGTAQKWYTSNHNDWGTFTAFSTAFEARYLTHALKAKARMAAQEYRQTQYQAVDEVIMDLNQLFRTARITDDELMRYYLLGALRPEIRQAVLRNAPPTYEKTCEHALNEGEVLAEAEAHELGGPSTNALYGLQATSKKAPTEIDQLTRLVEALTVNLMETSSAVKWLQADRTDVLSGSNPRPQQTSNGYRQYPPQSDESRTRFSRLKAERRCYNCKETGHISRDCVSERISQFQPTRPNDTYRPPEDRQPNPYARRQNAPPGFQDILETNYLDAESHAGDNDAEIFAITRANHHTAPYARPNQKQDTEEEHEEILQDMRTVRRQQQMDVDKKPKHQAVAPEPVRSAFPPHQPDPSSSTCAHASKSTRNQHQDHAPAPAPAHKVDHPRIEARRPMAIPLVSGLAELNVKELLNDTKVPISLAQLFYYAPSLRQDCTQLFKRNPDQEVHQVEEETPMQGTPEQDVFCSLKTLIKVNGEPLTAIVDTGAACSVITKDLVDRLGLRIDSVHGRVLITADGTRHHTAGAIDRLPIELKNRILPTRFAVFNHPGEQLILGMNWLRNHRVVVDMESNRLWLPHERIKGKYFTVHVQDKHRSATDQILQVTLESDSEGDNTPDFGFSDRSPYQHNDMEAPIFADPGNNAPGPSEWYPLVTEIQDEDDFTDNEYDVPGTYPQVMDEWSHTNRYPTIKPVEPMHDPKYQVLLDRLLQRYCHLFADSIDELEASGGIAFTHSIKTGDAAPIHVPPYRIPAAYKDVIHKEICRMLEAGVIRPSYSPWGAPVLPIAKKDGGIRVCVDYRRLNAVTVKDQFPMPHVEDILTSFHGCTIFASVDALSGFWQVPVDPSDRPKTAFGVPGLGLFEFNVMPFGLCNSPGTFQRAMQNILVDLPFCRVYIDDILVCSRNETEHLGHLQQLFAQLESVRFKLSRKKCLFFQTGLEYLGHFISARGIQPQESKLTALAKARPPQTVSEVRSFLGLTSYYSGFVDEYARLARPLYLLLRKKTVWTWGLEQQQAFDQLVAALLAKPVRASPDPELPYVLTTDGSTTGIAGVLSQVQKDGEHVIAYASRTLTPAEKNYHTTHLEGLAVVWAVRHFHHYLAGSKFDLHTDHAALVSLFSKDTTPVSGRLARWALRLREYNFQIHHIKGTKNIADFPSRCLPLKADELSVQPFDDDLDADDDRDAVFVLEHREELYSTMKKGNSQWNRGQTNSEDFVQLRYLKPVGRELSTPEGRFDDLFSMDYAVYVAISNYLRDQSYPRDALEKDREALRRRAQKYTLFQERLYRRTHVPTAPQLEVLHERNDLEKIRQIHDEFHLGVDNTYANVMKKYTGNGLKDRVQEVVSSCLLCQRHNPPNYAARAEPLHPVDVDSPFKVFGVDFVGPIYPPSAEGHTYIFTAIDYQSRWPIAVAAKSANTDTLVMFLLNHVVAQFGVPSQIISDRGSIFTDQVVARLFETLGVRHNTTTAYRPQANGRVERMHRSLKNLLAKLTTDNHRAWPDHLWKALLALRTTRNAITHYAPAEIVYGAGLTIPSSWEPRQDVASTADELERLWNRMDQIGERLDRIRDNATAYTRQSQARQKVRYDATVQPRSFQVGDMVLKKLNTTGNATHRSKFTENYAGPYTVRAHIGNGAYRIADEQGNLDTVHVDRLKTARIRQHMVPEVLTASTPIRRGIRQYRLHG